MHFPWQGFDDVTFLPLMPAAPRETESGPRRGKMCLCEFQSAIGSEAKKKKKKAALHFREFCVKVPFGSQPSKHFGAKPAANHSPGPAGPQGLKITPTNLLAGLRANGDSGLSHVLH